MNKLRVTILLTTLLGVAAVPLTFLLPVPVAWTDNQAVFHAKLVAAMFIPLLHILAAIFFFLGLEGFKQDLRLAYRLIAFGIIGFGISYLSSPLVTFLDLWDKDYMVYGYPNIPYIISLGVMFYGVRIIFDRFLIQGIWRPLWVNAAVVVGGALIVVAAPHAALNVPEVAFDLGNALFTLSSLGLIVAAANVFAVRSYVAPAYARALTWLSVGLIQVAILVGMSVVARLMGLDMRQATASLQDVLLLTAIPYMVAGYRFYQLTADVRGVEAETDSSPVDVVLYVASLASNQALIDPILDGLRGVTAHLHPDQRPSEADDSALAVVYLQIETYLTQYEQLRTFTVHQLRSLVWEKFNPMGTAVDAAFWSKLPLEQSTQTVRISSQPSAA